jgi:hypothetical protein
VDSFVVPGNTVAAGGDRLVLRGQIILPFGGIGANTVQIRFGGFPLINESLTPDPATAKVYNYECELTRWASASQMYTQSSFKGGFRATSNNVLGPQGIHSEYGDVSIVLDLALNQTAEVLLATGTNGDIISSSHFSVDFLPA